MFPDTPDAVPTDLVAIAARENRLVPVPAQLLDTLDDAASKASRASAAAATSVPSGGAPAPVPARARDQRQATIGGERDDGLLHAPHVATRPGPGR